MAHTRRYGSVLVCSIISISILQAQPPWPVTRTDNNHIIIIPLTAIPSIRGAALTVGDYLGVFFEKNGTLVCGGCTAWMGASNVSLTAWGDDATTADKDGFSPGEKLQWRMWRHSDGREAVAKADYAPANGIVSHTDAYAGGGISLATGFSDLAYELRLDRGELISSADYEFDLYLRNLSSQTLELSSLEVVLTLNPAVTTGTLSATIIAGTSDLLATQQPSAAVIIDNDLRISPMSPPAPGFGTMIPVSTERRIARIRIASSKPFLRERFDLGWKNTGSQPVTTLRCCINAAAQNITSLTPSTDHISLLENTVLPAELTAFTARVADNAVTLEWSTASEVNNWGFEVEKQRNNAWMRIGFVGGHGSENRPRAYSFTDRDLSAGIRAYRLKQIDRDGGYSYSREIDAQFHPMPSRTVLGQNYPNPFNPSTEVDYAISELCRVTIAVYDVTGQEVAVLADAVKPPGKYTVSFDASALASGVYWCRMRTWQERGVFVQTRKMLLVR